MTTGQRHARVTYRKPWTWRCGDQDLAWHEWVDDSGNHRTHAEAVAAADAHVRRWHDPANPTRVCGDVVDTYTDSDGDTWTSSHGIPLTCAMPDGHEGAHECAMRYPDPFSGDMPAVLGIHFDEFGLPITNPTTEGARP